MKTKKALGIGCGLLGVFVLALVIWIGPTVRDLWKAGFFEEVKRDEYVGGRSENLDALRTAVQLHHESEGAYPSAKTWLKDIEPRLTTNGMTREEALRKVRNPANPDDSTPYYELNPVVENQYDGDIRDRKTWLIREKDPNGSQILLDGTIETRKVP